MTDDDYQNLRLERDARGVATVWLDAPDAPVNVFNEGLLTDLAGVLDDLDHDRPRVVVFRSAKPSGFLAGADLKHIRQIATAEEARTVLSAGQKLFQRVERLPFPTVAAIHGPCLGGGLEFALACRYRVARDDGATKLGLPEVKLGLIPGWGGTQRLPRLVGLRRALEMILESSNLSAAKAAKVGLVDLASPPDDFDDALARFVDERLRGRTVRRPGDLLGTLFDRTWPGQAVVLEIARRKVTGDRGRHYPALAAALKAVRAGLAGPRDLGYATERDAFVSVLFTDAARSLIDVFFQREKARKLTTWAGGPKPRPVARAAVVGGGTMGAGIVQLLALNGVPVALKEVNGDLAAAGLERVKKLTADAARKGVLTAAEADDVARRVTATADWEPLADADLVVEAVVEREAVKREVFAELAKRLAPTAVLATNTSSLSVTRLAEGVANPNRVAGLHFFNPVHRMQLVEVVRGRDTDEATVAVLVELVRKLGKVPVVVADGPGFLVNRVLFPYLEEAIRLANEGVPADAVDKVAVRFGMPMGPLELLDTVGLDVGADIGVSLAGLVPEPSATAGRLEGMVKRGWLGKKSGRGFYEYAAGERGRPTPWDGPKAAAPADARDRLIYPMVNEAARCLAAGVVREAWAADLAMVLGIGFAPATGGPLRLADARGLRRVVADLEALRQKHGPRFAPCELLRSMAAGGRRFYPEATTTAADRREEVHR